MDTKTRLFIRSLLIARMAGLEFGTRKPCENSGINQPLPDDREACFLLAHNHLKGQIMSRVQMLQSILDTFDRPSYLEIGVFAGDTFLGLSANEKVGVDPKFLFDIEEPNKCPGVTLFPLRSDEYFSTLSSIDKFFDVVFLDGLHEYNQTLRDLMNVLTRLQPKGVIIVDDVVPSSYAASLSDTGLVHKVKNALGSKEAAWMGDIYRMVFFVRSFLPQFSYATVQGGREMIMWHEPRTDFVRESTEWVARRDFGDTIKYSDAYNWMPIEQIMERIRAANARA